MIRLSSGDTITQALAYQTRHVIDSMLGAGHAPIEVLYACGGLSKNPLYMQARANLHF